jgi:hypothetical protein
MKSSDTSWDFFISLRERGLPQIPQINTDFICFANFYRHNLSRPIGRNTEAQKSTLNSLPGSQKLLPTSRKPLPTSLFECKISKNKKAQNQLTFFLCFPCLSRKVGTNCGNISLPKAKYKDQLLLLRQRYPHLQTCPCINYGGA